MRGDAGGRYAQRFSVTTTRTSSELQDVQLAMYQDLLRLLRAVSGTNDTQEDAETRAETVFREILRQFMTHSTPESADGRAFMGVLDAIMQMKQPLGTDVSEQVARLQVSAW